MKIHRRQWGYVTRLNYPNGEVEVEEQYPRFWTRKGAEWYVEYFQEMLRADDPNLASVVEYEVVKLGPLGPNPYMLPEAEYQRWCRSEG